MPKSIGLYNSIYKLIPSIYAHKIDLTTSLPIDIPLDESPQAAIYFAPEIATSLIFDETTTVQTTPASDLWQFGCTM